MSFIDDFSEFCKHRPSKFDTYEDFLISLRDKTLNRLNVSHITTDSPTATILIGFSLSGLTSYAKKEMKSEDSIVSLDLSREELKSTSNQKEPDALEVIRQFDYTLSRESSAHKTIWVDGYWIDAVPRFALIVALRELGYKIRIITFLSEKWLDNITQGLLNSCYKTSDEDPLSRVIMREAIFIQWDIQAEVNLVNLQKKMNLLSVGADTFVEL